ncbi:unknown [Bacteroides sp. CAG:1060]|nr:unknown [Bacteroides sp. CAG:1060]
MVQPWKITMSPQSSASLRMLSYMAIVSCLSPPKKSTLMPFTPMLWSQRISFLRAMWSLIIFRGPCVMSFHHPLDEYQRNKSTFLERAYFASSSILSRPILVSQKLSMRQY